jgi:hypothetical protein
MCWLCEGETAGLPVLCMYPSPSLAGLVGIIKYFLLSVLLYMLLFFYLLLTATNQAPQCGDKVRVRGSKGWVGVAAGMGFRGGGNGGERCARARESGRILPVACWGVKFATLSCTTRQDTHFVLCDISSASFSAFSLASCSCTLMASARASTTASRFSCSFLIEAAAAWQSASALCSTVTPASPPPPAPAPEASRDTLEVSRPATTTLVSSSWSL